MGQPRPWTTQCFGQNEICNEFDFPLNAPLGFCSFFEFHTEKTDFDVETDGTNGNALHKIGKIIRR